MIEINFLKKKKKFKKGGLRIRPDIFWRYVLGMTIILVFLSCALGLYLFLKINKEPISSAISIDQKQTIRKERLKKVLDYFSEREKKSMEILNSPSPISDPSL